MLRLLVLYLCIVCISLVYCEILNTGFGKAAVMAYVSAAFIMLVSSVLGKLSYFKYLLGLFMVLLGILTYLKLHKEKRPIKDLTKALGPSFIIFTVFFFYLYITTKTKALTQIDDAVRWAAKVQEALRLDRLYTSSAYTYLGIDYYPPFTTLNEIFFNKMLGGYSDSASLLANSSLCFTLLLPFCDRLGFSKKDLLKSVSCLLIGILVMLSVNHNPTMNGYVFLFNTTYPDWMTGLMIGCGFLHILWFDDSLGDWLFFCFLNAALLQTDRICFAFSLLITVTLLFRLIFLKKLDRKSLRRYLVYAVAIPVMIYFAWRVYLSVFDPHLLFHLALPTDSVLRISDVSYKRLLGSASLSQGTRILTLHIADLQKGILTEFVRRLFTEPIYIHPFRISYFAFNLLVTAVLMILNFFNKEEKQLSVVALFYFLGSLAYAGVLCYAYMYLFPYEEAMSLAVYGRYMQSYTLSGIALLFYGLLSYVKHWAIYPAVILLGICFMEPLSIEHALPTPDKPVYKQNELSVIKEYIDREYDGEGTVVIDSNEITYFYLIRNLYGEKAANVVLFQNGVDGYPEDFNELCRRNDYILIGDYNDDFLDNYWKKVSDEECYNSTLYRIVHEDEGFRFEMVYGFEALAKELEQ